jgi:hypothetical protein
MPTRWPACDVLCNSIARGPHFDGEIVLHAFTDNKELKIVFEAPRYWTYCFFSKGRARWRRLAGGRDTVAEARDLALMVLREPV